MSVAGFWRELRQDSRDISISTNRLGKIANVHFLFPQGNGPRGSFTTFSALKPNLRSRDVIILGGVLREQAVAPLDVYDVTVMGAANRPRQATSGGVPTGGGACWLPPHTGAVATTPLIELQAAGWLFDNIEFSPHTNSAGIRLTRSAVVDTIDASHFTVQNCYFDGNGGSGQIGIEDNGGSGHGLVEGCRFANLASAVLGLNTGAAVPLGNAYRRNRFYQNTSDIKMSLSYGVIENNVFMTPWTGGAAFVINTIFLAAQGNNNMVIMNQTPDTDIDPAKGYKGSATDVWNNYQAGTAALVVVSPPA
jgi:hypothetical protein